MTPTWRFLQAQRLKSKDLGVERILARPPLRLRIAVALIATIVTLGTAASVGAIAPLGTSPGPRLAATTVGAAVGTGSSTTGNSVPIAGSPALQTRGSPAAIALAPRPQRPAELVTHRVAAKQAAPARRAAPASRPAYVGTNHMWMPALDINRALYLFSCTRSTALDNLVYRWGCAGRNNIYLMGHAWGVFKPLHDAYVQGRLRVGMEVIYADGSGRIHHYRITTWRVVLPTDTSWIGDMSRPTMILQTCIGANSTYRLNVKLVAVS